jgi:hypothetical protein
MKLSKLAAAGAMAALAGASLIGCSSSSGRSAFMRTVLATQMFPGVLFCCRCSSSS